MIFKIEQFRADLITKRVIERDISMDEAAKEIGVSKPTLSRIENRKLCDIETFAKIVVWLNKSASDYFEASATNPF